MDGELVGAGFTLALVALPFPQGLGSPWGFTFWMIVYYQSTFSALVVINWFLEMPNYLEIICLKCWKLKKLQGRAKYPKMVETQEPNPLLQRMYPIIDNIMVCISKRLRDLLANSS